MYFPHWKSSLRWLKNCHWRNGCFGQITSFSFKQRFGDYFCMLFFYTLGLL